MFRQTRFASSITALRRDFTLLPVQTSIESDQRTTSPIDLCCPSVLSTLAKISYVSSRLSRESLQPIRTSRWFSVAILDGKPMQPSIERDEALSPIASIRLAMFQMGTCHRSIPRQRSPPLFHSTRASACPHWSRWHVERQS